MAELTTTAAVTIMCPNCTATLGSAVAGRLKHHADGSHTVILAPTPPKAVTDPKPRGRRRG